LPFLSLNLLQLISGALVWVGFRHVATKLGPVAEPLIATSI